MSTIVAGRFHTFEQADRVVQELRRMRGPSCDISVFFVNPPGQHAAYPIGGDRYKDTRRGSEGAALGATVGALAGLAAGMLLHLLLDIGVILLIAAFALGAYLDSLVGTLRRAEDAYEQSPQSKPHPAGVMVAAKVRDAGEEQRVISLLRAREARDVEKTAGEISDGEWTDFHAVESPDRIDDT